MDEKGVQIGGGRKGNKEKMFFSRRQRVKLKVQSSNLQLVTIIECVCAEPGENGERNPLPGFVFPGVDMHGEWGMVHDDIIIATSENGWTSDFLCKEWFAQCFIPHAVKMNTSGKPILLI
ncbi:hypothetical protein BV25DRAFT_1783904, partial [Artomyces pyxidatus]